MKNQISNSILALKQNWREDLKAGFNVSLIALPLSLGIALASGFPPIAGLFAAILGGLIVSRINGSHVTITGPAAGLIVVNLAAIEMLGQGDNVAGYRYALAAILVAGVFIVLLGFLKAGKLGDFFPTSVIHGMLAAIGVIIMVKQFFVAVAVRAHGHEFYEIIEEIPIAIRHANPEVVLITVVSLLILIFHPRVKSKIVKAIPSPLWVLIVAIPLELLMDFEHEHELIFFGEHHKVGPQLLVHIPQNILDGVVFPDFGKIATSAFWIAVTSIALVTAIESLLSALAVDSLDSEQRKTNLDKDLKGLGMGSSLSAFIGGLPVITEIVRSSANISGGARTQWSNFFHGGFLLLFVLVGGPIIDHIPLSALAAMLLFTGYRLASPKEFKHVYETGKTELIVFVFTLAMVLLTDLLIGIACGIVLNLLINVLKGAAFTELFKVEVSEKVNGNAVVISPKGALVFSNYLSLKSFFNNNSENNVVLNLKNVSMIDHTVMSHLAKIKKTFEANGHQFFLSNDEHLNPVSESPTAERRANASKFIVKTTLRDKELMHLAQQSGWSYNPGSSHTEKWESFELFKGGKLIKENNILSFKTGDQWNAIADVVFETGAELSNVRLEVTCMFIQFSAPKFILEKEQLLDKVMGIAGVSDINFDSHPKFSSAYLLKGENISAVREFFNDEVLTFLENNEGFHVESNCEGLMFYSKSKQLSIAEIKEMVQFTEGFLQCITTEISS